MPDAPRLTAAQVDALRYVRAVTSTGLPIPVTPRADVLRRLAAAGLVTRTVDAYRLSSWDRWRDVTAHALTDTGRAVLADLDELDAMPHGLAEHNRRSAAARRAVGRAR